MKARRVRETATPIACICTSKRDDRRLYWRVTLRKSWIDTKGRQHDGGLSTVRCFKCKNEWRSRAPWVEDLEDATGQELQADTLGANSYRVKHWTGREMVVRATFYEDDPVFNPAFSMVERHGHYYAELDQSWSQIPDQGEEPDFYNSWRYLVYYHDGLKARQIGRIEYDGEDLARGALSGYGIAWEPGMPYHTMNTLRGLLVQVAYAEA
tara:strand:- start:67 stop:696 length:630 start_codon:yes stop_codon:yes gene_type:complete